jgi:hypothetical protein
MTKNSLRLFLVAIFIISMIAIITTSISRPPSKPTAFSRPDATATATDAGSGSDAAHAPTSRLTDASPVDAAATPPSSAPNLDDPTDAGIRPSVLAVENLTNDPTTVFVAFGADSVVLPGAWPFCTGSGLNCTFPLGKRMLKSLPLGGNYLNATFSFGAAVTCGITKAEINANNPKWYDTLDVSLVDGYSNKISISTLAFGQKPSQAVLLGPPKGKEGNEKVFGLFPYGCDVCVARQSPPCGIPKGRAGCKGGTQYKPDVVCQYQGPQKNLGNQKITIRLEK